MKKRNILSFSLEFSIIINLDMYDKIFTGNFPQKLVLVTCFFYFCSRYTHAFRVSNYG